MKTVKRQTAILQNNKVQWKWGHSLVLDFLWRVWQKLLIILICSFKKTLLSLYQSSEGHLFDLIRHSEWMTELIFENVTNFDLWQYTPLWLFLLTSHNGWVQNNHNCKATPSLKHFIIEQCFPVKISGRKTWGPCCLFIPDIEPSLETGNLSLCQGEERCSAAGWIMISMEQKTFLRDASFKKFLFLSQISIPHCQKWFSQTSLT